jgi:hypothetical protein
MSFHRTHFISSYANTDRGFAPKFSVFNAEVLKGRVVKAQGKVKRNPVSG